MTQPSPQIIWTGTVPSGTFRIIDLVDAPDGRFLIEKQDAPDALGSLGWSRVGLPYADMLEAAFGALYRPATSAPRA